MRTVARLLVVGLLAVTAGCSTQSADGLVTSSPMSPPTGPRSIGVGATVPHSMHTHCGVESTTLNGRVWNAVEPLYGSPDRLGPPDGWGNPYQDGSLTLESEDRAVFSALGERVVLTPSASGEPLRYCD